MKSIVHVQEGSLKFFLHMPYNFILDNYLGFMDYFHKLTAFINDI